MTVETVVLLTHEKPTSYIEVTMDYDTIVSEYKPKVKVTYKMIMDYIQEKYNISVKSTTIAEVKRSLGLEVGDYNKKILTCTEKLKLNLLHPVKLQHRYGTA